MKVIELDPDDKIFDITWCIYGSNLETYEEYGERFVGKSQDIVVNNFREAFPDREIVKVKELGLNER